MKIFVLFLIFILSTCGFSSYYSDSNTSGVEVKDARTREQINLTRVEFKLYENHDRILKDELLARMDRFDQNDKKDYRYIMLIHTSYFLFPGVTTLSGATIGMQIMFNTRYIIVDTQKINTFQEEIPEVSIERLPSDAIHESLAHHSHFFTKSPVLIPLDTPRTAVYSGKPTDAKDEHFERQAAYLRSNFKIVQEGSILNTEQYMTTVILLYDDYVAKERALELVAKATARDLMYNLIGIYSQYMKDNYNTKLIEPLSVRTEIDIAIDDARNKVASILVEYFSIPALRDVMVKLLTYSEDTKVN